MAENHIFYFEDGMLFCHKRKTLYETDELIDRHIHFCNNECIQVKTGEIPLMLRLSA